MAYWNFSLKNNQKAAPRSDTPRSGKEQILKAVKQAPTAIISQKTAGAQGKDRKIMDENKIPRMESIRRTAEIFSLPVHLVRQKVSSGEVVAIKAGRKFLVNVDKFAEYLNSCKLTPEPKPDEAASTGRIAPIDLRR